jgi:hypothetical protein
MLAACATTEGPSATTQGQWLFERAFDPELNFADDLEPSSNDQLILTARASNRDDYAPDYSLAVAHVCTLTGEPNGRFTCRYLARMLRVRGEGETRIDASGRLLHHVRAARRANAVAAALDDANLEWLEADLHQCEGALPALVAVQQADWRPDLHMPLTSPEQQDILLHPARLWVQMSGDNAATSWRGWRLAAGVAAAVETLVARLGPCWRSSATPRPWERQRRVN